ncbi:hypothetical protein BDZ89DRAFT_1114953 [Hymenopellis radicata]|nr:hypothetical protein BDZ89DRAFT_1114953 [Hymenopellis radicata]
MLHSFCPYVFLLFGASLCRGLQISLPATTPLGADTSVTLIPHQGDPPSFWLKTTRVDMQGKGHYYQQVSINDDVVLNFPTPHQYFVQAITEENLGTPDQLPFQTSNIVQVVSEGNSKNPTGMIVGILFGITFLLVCANIAIYMFIRRRRRQASSSSTSSMSSLRGYLASRYYGSPPQPVMSPTPSIMSADPYSPIKTMPFAHASFDARAGYGSRQSVTFPLPLYDANGVPRSFTDRQMQIRQRVYELQSAVLKLELRGGGAAGMGDVRLDAVNDEVDVLQLKTKIGTLNDYLESAWAMHQCNVIPQELAACF